MSRVVEFSRDGGKTWHQTEARDRSLVVSELMRHPVYADEFGNQYRMPVGCGVRS